MPLIPRLSLCRLFLAALGGVAALSPAHGLVIGFEGTGVAPNGVISPVPLPYSESGFVLRNGIPAAESGIFGEDTGGEENSGSDFFGWAFNGRIILEAEGGEAFTLNSFDAGHIGSIMGLDEFVPMEITGNLEGGGTVEFDLEFTIPWMTFVLPATFTNLTSVEFFTTLEGGGGIDNILINERRQPLPDGGGTWAFAGLAVVALAAAKHRLRRR